MLNQIYIHYINTLFVLESFIISCWLLKGKKIGIGIGQFAQKIGIGIGQFAQKIGIGIGHEKSWSVHHYLEVEPGCAVLQECTWTRV